MIGKSMTPYCSVFFIPIFPSGGGESILECTSCGGKFHGNAHEIRGEMANVQAELNAEIARRQQSYSANPSDVDNANELVAMYCAADRPDDALQLAAHLAQTNPQDANAQVMLARVHLDRNDLAQTFSSLQQALAINRGHADAHYYWAVAATSTEPPRIDEALTFAQKARDLGHPEAPGLVQAIEEFRAQGA